MADVPLASLAEFEARKGDVPAEQVNIVAELLDDASALILQAAEGSDAEWIDGTDPPPRVVVSVAVEVAYRAWSNPDALSQTSMGDVALSYTRGGTPDAVFLTRAELSRVLQASKRSRFRSMTMTSFPDDPQFGDMTL